MFQSTRIHLILSVMFSLLSAAGADADEVAVHFEVSARETVVGVPVILSIAIDNAKNFNTPSIPEIEGAAVQPQPGSNRSSMTQIINGRVSQRETVTYTYRIVPSRTGTMTIPRLTVKADGQSFTSDPIEVSVTKSDTGDLMFAEIRCDKSSVYVGQALPVTLRLWVRPYQDKRLSVRLDADDMFNLIDFKSSDWGDFTDEVPKLRDNFGQLRVRWMEDLRPDSQGSQRSYYLFEIPAVIWPQQPGPLTMQSPRIIMTYPVRLGRNDAFLGMGTLSLTESKPVAITAEPPKVTVKAPPTENQPPTFSGVVGQFDFNASVKPVDVSVGDPITLTMAITDRTPSPGARVDLLQPPALDRIPELVENFRMPSDPLAGTVNNRTKVFTQTIRAKGDQVTRVPPIAFSYFDPFAEKYVTRSTEAVAIKVTPASPLSMNSVVAAANPGSGAANNNGDSPRSTDLTEVAGGILANDNNVDAMLAQQRFVPGLAGIIALLVPPVLLAGVSIRRWSARSRVSNATSLRRRGARRKAIARVNAATSDDQRLQAQAISSAIGEYVADRFNLPPGALAAGDVTAALQHHEAPWDLVRHAETLLDECDQVIYAGGLAVETGSLAARSRDLINRLDRSSLQ